MEGYSILVTQYIGLQGTAALTRAFENQIDAHYPKYLARATKRFDSAEWMKDVEAHAVLEAYCKRRKIAEYYEVPVSEGGILTALWTLAKESGSGFILDQRKLPIRQETVEICELLEVNPYHLYSGGSLLIMVTEGELLREELEEHGIHAVIVGHSTSQKAHILMNDDVESHLNRPAEDELVRLGLVN